MIPKIIHYCWFGGNEKSDLLKACIKSWDKLKKQGYQIIEWNEDNCDMQENTFVSKMYAEKKWGFLGDYFRFKVLYEHGGIYLDTDAMVYKNFDKLLNCDFFCGYIYDCAMGTAILGGSKGNTIAKELMEIWNHIDESVVSNGVVTEYFYNHVLGFKLNGKRQSLLLQNGERIEIYPKEAFEAGKIIGKSYTLHFADGSWGKHVKKTSPKVKLLAARLPINLMALRQHKKANAYMKKDGKYQQWYLDGSR